MESFYVIARDESECWAPEVFEDHGIRAAFGLYLIRAGEATHVCSFSPSSWAEWLRNGFILSEDAPRNRWGEWSGQELTFENGGKTGRYFDLVDPGEVDSRFIAGPIEVDPEDVAAGLDPDSDEYHAAIWEAARDYFNDDPVAPDILDAAIFDRWQEERTAARRAENRPPLAHGRAPLPLFSAAWRRMQSENPQWGADLDGYRAERETLAGLGWI